MGSLRARRWPPRRASVRARAHLARRPVPCARARRAAAARRLLSNFSDYADNATVLQTSLQIAPRIPDWMRPRSGDPTPSHPWYRDMK